MSLIFYFIVYQEINPKDLFYFINSLAQWKRILSNWIIWILQMRYKNYWLNFFQKMMTNFIKIYYYYAKQ